MLLYSETPNVHGHTLKVAVIDASELDGAWDFELFRRLLRRQLEILEPLRYQLIDVPFKLHHPMWMENCDVDLDYHLRRVAVPSPGGRRELDEMIGEIASTPLERGRPLWEFHFVDGMAGDRFAVIGKVHHALADGVAAGNLLARAIEWSSSARLDDDAPPTAPTPADPIPTKTQLLRAAAGDHLRQLGRLPTLLKHTASGVSRVRRRSREREHEPALAQTFYPPRTFINHVLSPRRTFASATLALADVKQTSKHLGVTINDLVLAMSAGALRELLLRYDGSAEHPLIASVPASLDTSPDRLTGNELGGMFVSLAVHIADPLERVGLTRIATVIAKENFQLLGPALPSRWAAYFPPPLAPLAFRWLSRSDTQNKLYNLPISNVPGPREGGHLAGAPLSELYSVGPLTAGSGMNITVWSYVDQIAISVIADDKTLHDPHEATDAMLRAFNEIRTAAGLPGTLTEMPSVMGPAHSSVAT